MSRQSVAALVLVLPTTLLAGCYAAPYRDAAGLRFSDVTQEAGLGAFVHENGAFGQAWEPEVLGAGAAFFDFDGDGWLDILLVGGGSFRESELRDVPALWLYRNEGDGTFRLVTDEVGLGDVRAYGMGIAVADFDNDGDPDFLLTTLYENMLFRNDPGEGSTGRTFVEIGKEAGIGSEREWSTSAIFFDADRDGWLDLFVTNYLEWSPETDRNCIRHGRPGYCTPEESDGSASRFYRNNGDGTFEDRTREAGFSDAITPARNKALGVAEHDFNGDGWPDLYVGNDTERDLLYVNQGDGTFREQGVQRAVAYDLRGKSRAGMGVAAGVVDQTDQTTLFVGNFSREAVGVYRYTETGYFEERGEESRLTMPTFQTLTFGLLLFDVELDGDLDLMLANGHVQDYIEEIFPETSFRQSAQLFLNDGNGVFSEFGAGTAPFTDRFVGRGAAYGDYDRDGDLDVLFTDNGGIARLWRNEIVGPNSARLVLRGSPLNRDAYGSVVRGRVGDRVLTRRLSAGASYLSHSESVLTFGLGGAAAIDSVDVTWPDGSRTRLDALQAGTETVLDQQSGIVEVRQLARPTA